MRLTAINLQGFKSFPDRTSFVINGGLTGIVGPNGCGKSNLLDAIRWGLGESRAAALRGGTLQDVLFSGTNKRTMADWCTIEMRFANDKKADLGMWSAYPEIIVKRELGREGQSYFYINSQLVRRRDVVDLFRGTGVLSHSYAVVEQGMVGAIAEASPESLRQFLEDAAGVSHYKDRRRDTERRLTSSVANLEQINQLLDDLKRRCEALKRQARAAQRYCEISDSINDLEVLLIMDNRAQSENSLADKRRGLLAAQVALNETRQQIEILRDSDKKAHACRMEVAQVAQEKQTALTRIQSAAEQARHDCKQAEEKRTQLQQRLLVAHREQEEVTATLQQCATDRKQCAEEIAGISRELEQQLTASEEQADELARLQQALHEAEQNMESAREILIAAQQRREALLLRQRLADEQRETWRQRKSDLLIAQEKLNDSDSDAPLPPDDAKRQVAVLEAEFTRLVGDGHHLEATAKEARIAAREAENKLVVEEAKYAALEALAVDSQPWQENAPPRVADALQPQAGEWAVALDAALGRYADGYAVESIDSFLSTKGLPPNGTALVEISAALPITPPHRKWRTLLSYIQAPAAGLPLLTTWLNGVYAAESLQEAQNMRSQLTAGEMAVTRDGVVFTRESVFVRGEVRGGFDWRRRRTVLAESVAASKKILSHLTQQADKAQQQLSVCEKTRAETTKNLDTARAVLSERLIAYSQWEERCRAINTRRRDIVNELSVAETRLQEMEAAVADMTSIAHAEDDCTRADEILLANKDVVRKAAAALEKCRGDFHHFAVVRRELHVREENLKRQETTLKAREEEYQRRREDLRTRRQQNESDVANFDKAVLASKVKEWEDQAVLAEQAAHQANAEVATWEQRITTIATARERDFTELQERQEAYTALQVEEKEVAMRVEGLNNSLEEFSVNETRLAVLREEKNNTAPEILRAEIDALFEKRRRLGAINFAAANELTTANEQLQQLQREQDDVESAMAELQNTIRRLDTETRSRLRDRYESVNRHFAALFKRLFGGGEAMLAMEGDSILDASFEIRARIPGKRMFPVRLLSGGEKSGTALAFVFALMQETPPPFCIMDEVDAALDEAYVESFLSLLRDLSTHFQCMIITHNKNSIEAMDALIGVTQEEKGVSKVVSVLLDDALREVT